MRALTRLFGNPKDPPAFVVGPAKALPKPKLRRMRSSAHPDGKALYPHFGHRLGIGVALIGWVVELKDGTSAIMVPFDGCTTLTAVAWTAVELPSATFAGVVFWLATLVSSTIALALYVCGKLK